MIHYWAPSDGVLYMLFVYSKSEQGDLTPAQLHALAKRVRKEFK